MADGDLAAAAGLPVVAGTADRRDGYKEINKTRDQLVSRVFPTGQIADAAITTAKIPDGAVTPAKLSGTLPIANGGTGATTASAARVALGAIGNNGAYPTLVGWDGSNFEYEVPGYVFPTKLRDLGDGQFGNTPIYSPHGRANGVSGGLNAYLGADGRLAVSSSSRRFKKDIRSWSPDKQAILAMRLVEFHWKAAYDGIDGAWDHGLIAEELADLGLEWLIWRDEGGIPAGVRYELVGLALLPVVQNHEERIAALEAAS